MTTAARDAALVGNTLVSTVTIKDVTFANGTYAIHTEYKGKILLFILTKDKAALKLKKGGKLSIKAKILKATLDGKFLNVYTYQEKLP